MDDSHALLIEYFHRLPLQASLKDDTNAINETSEPSDFDILTKQRTDDFALTRHRPTCRDSSRPYGFKNFPTAHFKK
jgi:hypothetical protein